MTSKAAAGRKEEPAIPAGIQYLPLNRLLLSSRNVRKTNPDEDIESLADDIAARGLIHNLVVTIAPGGKGFHEVDAGGRRWRALQLLAERKQIPRNFPVPCRIEPREQAVETSLAENIHRIAMSPADECTAFTTVIAGYADDFVGAALPARDAEAERIAHCARRFGVPERHVRQRLRLAELHPEIFDALRDGKISLDSAKAYAGTPDQDLQHRVWKDERKSYGPDNPHAHEPKRVRDRLAGKVYAVDHPAVRYIGLDAYTQAGGRVETDHFFGTDDRSILLDPSIVDRLTREKAAEEAQRLAQEAGFLDGAVKPWSGPAWAEPKAPEGYERKFLSHDPLPDEQRATAVTAFELKEQEDGTVALAPYRYEIAFVKPAAPRADAQQSPMPVRDWAAEERADQIRWRAARLAAPPLAGTAMEGRAFWPAEMHHYLNAWEERDDGTCIVALLIKVDKADVEAAMAEAEARYNAELAELAEEEAALEAEEAAAEAPVSAPAPRPEPVS